MFCTKCGTKLLDDALFCTSCGNRVKTAAVASVAAPVVAEPVVAEPVVETPVAPVVAEPVVETPVVAEPVVETPIVAEPVVEAPVVAEPVVETPVVVEPVVEAPVVAEPVVEAPVVVEPQTIAPPPVLEPTYTEPQIPDTTVIETPAVETYSAQPETPVMQTYDSQPVVAPTPVAPAPAFDNSYAYGQNTGTVSSGVDYIVEAVQNAGSNICVLLAGIFGLAGVLYPIFSRVISAARFGYAVPGSQIIINLFSGIFMILISVGLIMIFASSKKKSRKSGGYTMIKVVLVIDVVFLGIAAGIILILLLTAIVYAAAAYNRMPDFIRDSIFEVIRELGLGNDIAAVVIALVVMLILITTVFVLTFMWYGKMIKTMNFAKTALAGGPISGKNASMYVIVFKFIGLAFGLIGLIVSLIATIVGGGLMFGSGMVPADLSYVLSSLGIGSFGIGSSLIDFLFGLFYVIALINGRSLINAAKRMN